MEVASPVSSINSAEDMDRLIQAFEELYEKVYAGVAKHPQAGYQVMELGITASVPKVKPNLVKQPMVGKNIAPQAIKGEREVFMNAQWHNTPIIDMDQIKPGNEIEGIAIIEAPSTTLVLPPGKRVSMDEWTMIWLTDA